MPDKDFTPALEELARRRLSATMDWRKIETEIVRFLGSEAEQVAGTWWSDDSINVTALALFLADNLKPEASGK